MVIAFNIYIGVTNGLFQDGIVFNVAYICPVQKIVIIEQIHVNTKNKKYQCISIAQKK